MARTIKWKCTDQDLDMAVRIAERAVAMAKKRGIKRPAIEYQMDVLATHLNGCPLRLQDLLEADNFNFAHDIGGIARHLDRDTAKLTGCFLPRFAKGGRDV